MTQLFLQDHGGLWDWCECRLTTSTRHFLVFFFCFLVKHTTQWKTGSSIWSLDFQPAVEALKHAVIKMCWNSSIHPHPPLSRSPLANRGQLAKINNLFSFRLDVVGSFHLHVIPLSTTHMGSHNQQAQEFCWNVHYSFENALVWLWANKPSW